MTLLLHKGRNLSLLEVIFDNSIVFKKDLLLNSKIPCRWAKNSLQPNLVI